MTRTKKSIHNIIYAFIFQMISTLANFVVRTMMVRCLGMQAVGLNGLFTEVISALSLAELGVGSAIIYNLYKPLAEDDKDKICQLMGLFQKAYRIIALVTILISIILLPWIHLLVKSVDYPLNYIRIVYILFAINLSVSYLFSYKCSLLIADQKNYIQSRINIVVRVLGAIFKCIILLVTQNFILYLVAEIVLTVLGNLYLTYTVSRMYPWLKYNNQQLPDEERKTVFSNIKNLFIKSLSGKITSSTDNILISTLVNTIQVGYYSNYSLIIGVFRQIANQIAYGGLSASLGNLLVTETEEKCLKVFYRLFYLFFVIGAVSCVGIYCCMTPTILVWMESEEFLLGNSILFICCLNFFMEVVNRPLWSVMEVTGLFKEDKYVSIAGSLVNLVVSIIAGLEYGMLGIFAGTFLTYLVQCILKARLLFEKKFRCTANRYYVVLVAMLAGTLLLMFVCRNICDKIHFDNVLLNMLLYGVISVAITVGSIILCTFRTEAFEYYNNLLKRFLMRKGEQ